MATEYIRVYTRIKPSDAEAKVLIINGNCLEVKTLNTVNSYAYDGVLTEDCSQVDVFNCVGKRIVESCVDGYNGTIFAYGQTGSGKTHTMMGQSGSLSYLYNDLQKGIVPRSAELLVDLLDKKKRELDSFQFEISVSFVELYNEIIYDLLGEEQKQLVLRSDDKVVTLVDVTKEIVTSDVDIMRTVEIGLTRRSKGATAMNMESSRSHAIFIIEITMEEGCAGVTNRKHCTLNLVDLAGSERQSQSLATGARLKEAGNINQSLTVLGRVIRTLTQDKDSFVPYRDSKLTHILKDSLGGNSRTAVIASVHPDKAFYAETISTLRFAQQCKMVKNKASANREVTGESVDSLKKEISRLIGLNEEISIAHRAAMEEIENALRSTQIEVDNLEQANKSLRREIEQSKTHESELRSQMRKVCVDSFADVTNITEPSNNLQLTPKQRKERRRTRYTLSSQKDTLQRHQEKKGVSIVWGDEEIAVEEPDASKENVDDEVTAMLKENNAKLLLENQDLVKQCKEYLQEKKSLEQLILTTSNKLKTSVDVEHALLLQLEEKASQECKLQKEIDELNQRAMELEELMQEFTTESEKEKTAYKFELASAKSKCEAVQAELDSLKPFLEVAHKEKRRLQVEFEKELRRMQAEIDHTNMKREEEQKIHDQLINMMIKESKAKVEHLLNKNNRLEHDMQTQVHSSHQFEKERRQLESIVERQKEELRRQTVDYQRLRDENELLLSKQSTMLQSHSEEVKQLTKRCNENFDSLAEAERASEEAICKKQSIEKKLAVLEEELAETKLKLEKSLKDNKELESNNELLNAQHNEDVSRLDSVFGHTNNKQKIKEFMRLKEEVLSLKKKNAIYEAQLGVIEGVTEGKVTRSRTKAAAALSGN